MRLRPLIAMLTLLGWLFAFGHVVVEHGGLEEFAARHEFAACDRHGDSGGHDDAPPGGDHHHNIAGLGSNQWVKCLGSDKVLPPPAVLFAPFVDCLIASLKEAQAGDPAFAFAHAPPPDSRASGWLLVAKTALPVRGPSLVS